MEPGNYKSLHDYLDAIFKDSSPSENEIIQAKKDYWKAYNTKLKQAKRKKTKEVTISLNKETLELLNQKLIAGESISSYIQRILKTNLQIIETTGFFEKELGLKIEQQLFIIIDYLESLLYQRKQTKKPTTRLILSVRTSNSTISRNWISV
jgi:hypothetical protein